MSLNAADLPGRQTYTAIADSTGVCTITIQTQGNLPWQVEQVTTSMPTAPAGSVANMYLNDDLITPLIAAADVAGGDPPLPVHPGDKLRITWTGVTAGSQGKATVLYRSARYAR